MEGFLEEVMFDFERIEVCHRNQLLGQRHMQKPDGINSIIFLEIIST